MGTFDKKLSGIMVKYGFFPEEQREQVLGAAAEAQKSLTQYVVDQNMAAEADIVCAVSEEMSIPPIDIERVEIAAEALELVPEELARRYQVLPLARIGNSLTLAVSNPMDVLVQDEVSGVTGCTLMPVISTDVAIMRTVAKIYGEPQEEEEEQEQSHEQMQSLVDEFGEDDLELAQESEEDVNVAAEAAASKSAPVVKFVNLIIMEGVKAGASGIHIEPYEKRIRLRYRVDGACMEKMSPPKKMHNAVVSRVKILCNLNIAECRVPQDGKFRMTLKGRQIDFRVSLVPLVHGERIVMRILDKSATAMEIEGLGFHGKSLDDFEEAIKCANGMVLVTGPTGCGKTTTLYAAVKKVICVEDNITTVEDPVEYTMEGINQVQVDDRRGLTFGAALRSILRQDPDTVLIGEIRDQETAEIAVKAALTGHLVFSTLHTNDASSTITRLVNMGVDSFLVASTVILVTAQRLVRQLCPECRQSYKATAEQMGDWGFSEEEIGAEPDLFMPVGCGRCNNLGYKGRRALIETLRLNDELRETISRGASVVDVKTSGLEMGMVTLRRVGLMNAMRGDTSMQEVLKETMPDR